MSDENKPVETRIASAAVNLQAVIEKTKLLLPLLQQITPEEKQPVLAGVAAYAQQPGHPDTFVPPDPIEALGRQLHNVAGLLEVFQNVNSGSAAVSDNAKAAAHQPWETIAGFGTVLWSLQAGLNSSQQAVSGKPFDAHNFAEPGRYDAILAPLNEIIAQAFQVQKSLEPDVKALLVQSLNVRSLPAAAPTPAVTQATATPLHTLGQFEQPNAAAR